MSRMAKLIGAFTIVSLGMAGHAFASCSGANPNDSDPDDYYLQICLNNGGTITLDPGTPGYIVDSDLVLSVGGTVLTSSSAPTTRAKIIAGPNLGGFIITTQGGVNNFQISYISFDGKLHDGSYRSAKGTCPYLAAGNIAVEGNGFVVAHNESVNALCSSGIQVLGQGFEVYDNYVAYNGTPTDLGGPVSDGITGVNCSYGSSIHNNVVVDNTDVGIVVDSAGGSCSIYGNYVFNGGSTGIVGIEVGLFNDQGNHPDMEVSSNTIHGDADDRMGIGLLVGDDPFASNHQVSNAGYVHDNTVDGAGINLVIEGIDNGTVTSNSLSNPRGSFAGWGCFLGPMNYTAYDFGSATIDGGYVSMEFNDAVCTINP